MNPPRRATATLALYERGSINVIHATNSLTYLKEWAELEVYTAETDEYRATWQAELDAANKALATI